MPTPAALFGSLVFGVIGLVAFRYGKKSAFIVPTLLGLGLMIYPWFVSETWMLYVIGCALTGAVWFLRN